jgi:phenylalanyl-tRNA synthetase beta chain
MKVSVNWIKWYTDIELPPIDELVTKIGAQLGAVEEVIDVGAKYKGVVVAKIVSCEKHPNADKLNVCLIDDGGVTQDIERNEQGLVQVVCGAPNAREGIFVAWIPPKAIVPSTYNTTDPFTLEARELRGIISNGMLASGTELGINEDNKGILEIDEDVQPGQLLAEVYGLDDYIIDIENKMFTHRPDLFGQLGVAREIAGILGQKFTSPDWYAHVRQDIFSEHGSQERKLTVVYNEVPDLVPRFIAVSLSNITVKPSPIWMQSYLSRVGIRPINNIVDITNYIMMLTAQPLHAYDYDKVVALDYELNPIQEKLEPETEARKKAHVTLSVRYPREGETIKLLNGKEITPRPEAIMIASQKHLIGVGGVMGGSETEVDENTKNIILECANFDMYSIRRTSMAHGLFTDAVTRFNKGQSPLQNDRIIAQATAMIQEFAGGEVAGINDWDRDMGEKQAGKSVSVSAEYINDRLGLDIEGDTIRHILKNVEFNSQVEDDTSRFDVPFWRTDIEIPEDIVEEVGRLYGYDKLPLELPKRSIMPVQKDALLEVKSKIRNELSRAGANEVLSYSFVHGDVLEKVGQDKNLAFELSNAISPDLQYYRLSLTPSLLEKVHANIRAGYDKFALFEIGKAHHNNQIDENGLPIERERLSFVIAADQKAAQGIAGAAYYYAKGYLSNLLDKLGVRGAVAFEPLVPSQDISSTVYYELGRAATIKVNDVIIGRIGEYKSSARRALKLPEFTAGFELGLTPLLGLVADTSQYVALPKFPKITQDVTLKVPSGIPHAVIAKFAYEFMDQHKPENTRLEITDKDIYQSDTDKDYKQVTFGVSIASYIKTMRDEEVAKILDNLAVSVAERY